MPNLPAFDIVTKTLETFKSQFGFSKVTFYPLDYYIMNITTTNLGTRQKMVSTIDFVDEQSGVIKPIAAIAPDDKSLIQNIMFKNFDIPSQRDRIEVIEKGKKFGILVY